MVMALDLHRKNTIVTIIILAAAVAAALLMGYDAERWIEGAPGYVSWSLMPYAVLLGLHLANFTGRWRALSTQEIAWSFTGIAIAGPLLYVDIRFLHPDAQGAIAMLMVPILQLLLLIVILAISLLWHRFSKKENNLVLLFLNKSALLICSLYILISAVQYSDAKTIDTAKEVDFFIMQYCKTHGLLPTFSQLQVRYPGLNRDTGWFFYTYTDDPTWLKMQYPVKWTNSRAMGEPKTSEFTATTYSYTIEYHCGETR